MNDLGTVLALHDLDQLQELLQDRARVARLRRLGYGPHDAMALRQARGRLESALDRRWLSLYERSLARYGRGVTPVRDRVCQGCFLTLPTSAAPPVGGAQLHLCEGCGRLLYWR